MKSKSMSMLRKALDHLCSALDLLDRGGAPAHIVAHIDLGLNQLTLLIADTSEGATPTPIGEGALRH